MYYFFLDNFDSFNFKKGLNLTDFKAKMKNFAKNYFFNHENLNSKNRKLGKKK